MIEALRPPEEYPEHWFRTQSLNLLKEQLKERTYLNYPSERLTWSNGAERASITGSIYLPDGPWHIVGDDPVEDTNNRQLHPWIDSMLDESIGVVTGKGFYWHWGANFTADPVIIRTDTPEPMVLTVLRADTKQWALAGGFIEPRESAEQAAYREAAEETEVEWLQYTEKMSPVYSGPLADIRATAHAWPETQAFGIYLAPELSAHIPTASYVPANDEVDLVAWQTRVQTEAHMFGSHKLLIQLALRNEGLI